MASRRERHVALYTRDTDLFDQTMRYTSSGITWEATPCAYCGDPATSEDHVYPISALTKLGPIAHRVPHELLRIVPACMECNLLGGKNVFQSFEDKRLFIKYKLMKRYHHVVDSPRWSDAEIAQLRGRLHDWIANGENLREIVFERWRF